jgi:hypothetical protein
VAERDPPARQVRELWALVGRRGGKDSIASAIAAVAAMGDYRAYLRPGERASILCLACDREQARIVHRYVVAYFQSNPLLKPLIERETDDGLELTNSVEIIVATNSFRAVRGRTIIAVILDEVSFWRSEDSATPDIEVHNALLPGLVTLPGAMMIGISTPYRRAGLLFERWRHAYGKDNDEVLVVRGASRLFNPLLPQSVVDRALANDPEAAAAEWLADWRTDLSDYIDRAVVDACVARGIVEVPPAVGPTYAAFVDPAGGPGGDSMTLAIGHLERDNCAVLDCLRERRPLFDPSSVVAEFAEVLRSYGVTRIVGDRFGGLWPVESFARAGIAYEQSAAPKSDQYRELLPLLNGGRVRLLDQPRMIAQLCALERRTARSGKDSIAEPSGAHDDLCNAAAGVLTLLAADSAPSLISRTDLAPVEPSVGLRFVYLFYAVVWVGLDGRAAYAIFAMTRRPGASILLIDFERSNWSPAMMDAVARRLDDLCEQAHDEQKLSATFGVSAVLHVPEPLLRVGHWSMVKAFEQRANRHDVLMRVIACEPIEGTWLADPDKLAFDAVSHVGTGRVKLGASADAKSCEVPLFGVLGVRPGERVDADPLRVALLLGIVMAFQLAPKKAG